MTRQQPPSQATTFSTPPGSPSCVQSWRMSGSASTFSLARRSPGLSFAFRFGLPGASLGAEVRLKGAKSLHLAAQLLRNAMGVDAVANDLRTYKDDQLGALRRSGIVSRKEFADDGYLIEPRNTFAGAFPAFTDQSGQEHSLSACNTNRASNLALRYGRGQSTLGRGLRDRANFLLNVQEHVAIGVDPRRDPQD